MPTTKTYEIDFTGLANGSPAAHGFTALDMTRWTISGGRLIMTGSGDHTNGQLVRPAPGPSQSIRVFFEGNLANASGGEWYGKGLGTMVRDNDDSNNHRGWSGRVITGNEVHIWDYWYGGPVNPRSVVNLSRPMNDASLHCLETTVVTNAGGTANVVTNKLYDVTAGNELLASHSYEDTSELVDKGITGKIGVLGFGTPDISITRIEIFDGMPTQLVFNEPEPIPPYVATPISLVDPALRYSSQMSGALAEHWRDDDGIVIGPPPFVSLPGNLMPEWDIPAVHVHGEGVVALRLNASTTASQISIPLVGMPRSGFTAQVDWDLKQAGIDRIPLDNNTFNICSFGPVDVAFHLGNLIVKWPTGQSASFDIPPAVGDIEADTVYRTRLVFPPAGSEDGVLVYLNDVLVGEAGAGLDPNNFATSDYLNRPGFNIGSGAYQQHFTWSNLTLWNTRLIPGEAAPTPTRESRIIADYEGSTRERTTDLRGIVFGLVNDSLRGTHVQQTIALHRITDLTRETLRWSGPGEGRKQVNGSWYSWPSLTYHTSFLQPHHAVHATAGYDVSVIDSGQPGGYEDPTNSAVHGGTSVETLTNTWLAVTRAALVELIAICALKGCRGVKSITMTNEPGEWSYKNGQASIDRYVALFPLFYAMVKDVDPTIEVCLGEHKWIGNSMNQPIAQALADANFSLPVGYATHHYDNDSDLIRREAEAIKAFWLAEFGQALPYLCMTEGNIHLYGGLTEASRGVPVFSTSWAAALLAQNLDVAEQQGYRHWDHFIGADGFADTGRTDVRMGLTTATGYVNPVGHAYEFHARQAPVRLLGVENEGYWGSNAEISRDAEGTRLTIRGYNTGWDYTVDNHLDQVIEVTDAPPNLQVTHCYRVNRTRSSYPESGSDTLINEPGLPTITYQGTTALITLPVGPESLYYIEASVAGGGPIDYPGGSMIVNAPRPTITVALPVTINWTAVAGADAYDVYRNGSVLSANQAGVTWSGNLQQNDRIQIIAKASGEVIAIYDPVIIMEDK